jgi:capsular polysaccharide transport system permease protein
MSLANAREIHLFVDEQWKKLTQFSRLIGAVLLQDMRTRFGASYLGYLIAIGWPLSHMTILTAGYYLRTSFAPIGDSPTMFVATGVAPYILSVYPGRAMSLAVLQNRQLLNIPALSPFHLICSRCILEMLSAVVVLAIFVFALYLLDVDIAPIDTIEATKAISAAIFLGLGIGTLNVVMCAIFGHYFMVLYIIIMVSLYIFSGVYIPAWTIPDEIREFMAYNPLLHIVEWLRSAYYASYDGELIDKPFVIGVASVCLLLGLSGERYLRGKFFS